jgi:hypothetical protein
MAESFSALRTRLLSITRKFNIVKIIKKTVIHIFQKLHIYYIQAYIRQFQDSTVDGYGLDGRMIGFKTPQGQKLPLPSVFQKVLGPTHLP